MNGVTRRERIVKQVLSGHTQQAVAPAAGVCPHTVRKWVERFKTEGVMRRVSPSAKSKMRTT
ncbi:helix-turn-helix domain-containing protein [Mesorhizobium sp. M0514]|uniref:helix-turn-helix domain-containing protein n=1 Tax=Mesorhizobium sp. M0514 TaxID=2956955 RepID=UPI00333BC6D3